MKKQCPNCHTEVKKFWKSAVGGVILGFCPTCKRKVNLGRADGATGSAGDGGKKAAEEKEEKKGGKTSRSKAAARSGRKQPVARPPVSSESAAKRSGLGAAVRDFFDI
jgi:hypothetical protein